MVFSSLLRKTECTPGIFLASICFSVRRTKNLARKDLLQWSGPFFIDWIEKEKNYRNFILELHHLGFRAPQHHDLTINKLLTKKIAQAQLRYVNGHASEEFRN